MGAVDELNPAQGGGRNLEGNQRRVSPLLKQAASVRSASRGAGSVEASTVDRGWDGVSPHRESSCRPGPAEDCRRLASMTRRR